MEIENLVGAPDKLRALGWEPKHTVTKALRDVLGPPPSTVDVISKI